MKIRALTLLIGTLVGCTTVNAQNSDTIQCLSPDLIDCTPIQNCVQPRDDRDCNKCLLSVFGRCQMQGNDPLCEAAKASRNGVYAADKLQCEAQKASQKLQCEATKESLKAAAAACAQR
jgi:hypothetical protein